MPDKLRVVSPADAKAVWEAIEAEGRTPSIRSVADRLAAAGTFEKVNPTTISRWRNKGWTRTKEGPRKPAAVVEATRVQDNLPAVTGDATKATNKKADPKEDQKETDELNKLTVSELSELAIKEGLIAAVKTFRRVQERADTIGKDPEEDLPHSLGQLQATLAGSLGRVFEGMKTRLDMIDREMKVIPGAAAAPAAAQVDIDWANLKQPDVVS